MKKTLLGILLAVSALLAPGLASAAPFSALYAFGDSLSDNGNLAAYGVPFPPGYADRFSNGPVAVEQLAGMLGIAPGNLHDYAFGGAETGTSNPDLAGTGLANTGVKSQVAAFAAATLHADSNALYFLWAGANDLLNGVGNGESQLQLQQRIVDALSNINWEITTLKTLGATHFLVPNLPDLGLTPLGQSLGSTGAALLSGLAASFNQALAAGLPSYVTQADTFTLLDQVVANPAAYGLSNATDTCFTNAGICSQPEQYLFWDHLHPTTTADTLLAQTFAAAVPEPASTALVALGLVAMALRRRMPQATRPAQMVA